ncbi:TRAP transporter TatT component family protein [Methylomarinum sp. Ch1-1]|uniref:TRAP transporter TatT component family protein n=1 Tax=Methylomarinum roseum TaxID=3067653 RepID=A0AAU7NTA6_9GAMM
MRNRSMKALLLVTLVLACNGCSFFITSAAKDFGSHLQQAMLNSNDPEMVAQAIPAYLLMQEALLLSEPEDEALLLSTARLYASYTALMADDEPSRNRRLTEKALSFAVRAACLHKQALCDVQTLTFAEFSTVIEDTEKEDLESLYALGTAWAGWIRAHAGDWRAVAQLAQVKRLMRHVCEMDEDYRDGEIYLYLGMLESILPPALGGKPDLARHYFEKAISLSAEKNLMAPVLYARYYARMVFDRELHDRLLEAVIAANPQQNGLTLINTLAQQRAAELLQSADDYF